MFTFLLVLCVAAPSLAGVLPGLLTPWEHQHIKQGDKVYLIRLGEEPRGIVASGRALSGVFTGTHWDEERRSSGVQAKRIYVKFEDIRLKDGLILPIQVLKMQFPSVHWSAQASGIHIPEDVAVGLKGLWK